MILNLDHLGYSYIFYRNFLCSALYYAKLDCPRFPPSYFFPQPRDTQKDLVFQRVYFTVVRAVRIYCLADPSDVLTKQTVSAEELHEMLINFAML